MAYIDPRTKVLWHVDKLQELRRMGRTSAPVNVEIDLSNRCSLGCEWCHFAYTHTRGPLAGSAKPDKSIPGGDLMDFDLAQRIVHQLANAGVQSITWTGGGEPTLHPHFDAIVAGTPLEQGLYTHGGHISEERAALLKRRLTWVYVSLDECEPDKYRASKGVDRYAQATEGIRRLVAAPGNATVGVGFLLHDGNWRDVHSMVRLGKELGADYVQFRPTVRYDQAQPSERVELPEWIDRAVGRLNAYRDDPFVVADTQRFKEYQTWTGHGYSTCHWSAMQTVITPNGKMWRCVNKREQADALIGDLATEDFADVWRYAGKPCQVDSQCRIFCRGHIANVALDAVMREPAHMNFI